MKRIACLFVVLMMVLSAGSQVFAGDLPNVHKYDDPKTGPERWYGEQYPGICGDLQAEILSLEVVKDKFGMDTQRLRDRMGFPTRRALPLLGISALDIRGEDESPVKLSPEKKVLLPGLANYLKAHAKEIEGFIDNRQEMNRTLLDFANKDGSLKYRLTMWAKFRIYQIPRDKESGQGRGSSNLVACDLTDYDPCLIVWVNRVEIRCPKTGKIVATYDGNGKKLPAK